VLKLVVAGKSSIEVAEMLDISKKTVESFRARIKDKTRAQDAWELVRMWRVWKRMDEKQ
jgi:FixJ family two-component response regulator